MPRDSHSDVSRDTVSLTYQELADRLGIDVQSARRRALRSHWLKVRGNDGRARVNVPATVLPTAPAIVAPALAPAEPPLVGPVPATPKVLSHLLSQVAEMGELRERLGRAEGERDTLQAMAAALRDDVQAERERANAALERAVDAEARLMAGSPTMRAMKAWRAFLAARKRR